MSPQRALLKVTQSPYPWGSETTFQSRPNKKFGWRAVGYLRKSLRAQQNLNGLQNMTTKMYKFTDSLIIVVEVM